ncbi:hypothetical protein ABW20_dc0103609 [Dactylellina cionopaga]|nr:hypothetical protein ABW20_dc0103609 [Dactylellina cionopaga]
MLALLLHAMLAASSHAAEIRRRQGTVNIATPRVMVPGGGGNPVQNYYVNPQANSGFDPNAAIDPNQNIVIPDSIPAIEPPAGDTGSPGPDGSPGGDGMPPSDPNGMPPPPGGDTPTSEAVAALSDSQRDALLENTSANEFAAAPPEYQEYVLEALKDQLSSTQTEAEQMGIDPEKELPEPETLPSLESYKEIQNLALQLTQALPALSEQMEQLVDQSIEEIHTNETLDATDESGTNGTAIAGRKDKRFLLAALGVATSIYNGAKIVGDIFNTGAKLWNTIDEVATGITGGQPQTVGGAPVQQAPQQAGQPTNFNIAKQSFPVAGQTATSKTGAAAVPRCQIPAGFQLVPIK